MSYCGYDEFRLSMGLPWENVQENIGNVNLYYRKDIRTERVCDGNTEYQSEGKSYAVVQSLPPQKVIVNFICKISGLLTDILAYVHVLIISFPF